MLTLEKKLRITPETCREPNLTSHFSSVDLGRIAAEVYDGYAADERSRDGWRKVNAAGWGDYEAADYDDLVDHPLARQR